MTTAAKLPLWLPFSAEASIDLVGGKGAALSRLVGAGLPVPPGATLTTAAYRRFVAGGDLWPSIAAALAGASPNDPAALERAAAAIGERLAGAPLPDDVAAAIRAAYATLGAEAAVAARSSATAEDLPEQSFAGQQETVLNVRGEAALFDAVRACWASLWSARAIAYRARLGIAPEAVAMAVVIQTMVPAEVSGILFTANPATGDRDQIVVEAGFGLGEGVVSGALTPDAYTLDKATLETTGVALGEKAVAVVPADDGQGTTAREVAAERRGERALPEPLLRELAALGLRAEDLAGGAPQDVEWAAAGDTIWLLQARPITGLPPAPPPEVRWEPPIPGTVWVRRQIVEHMPGPLSPLFADLYLRRGLEEAMGEILTVFGVPDEIMEIVERPIFATVNGYAYMRGSYDLSWRIVLPLLRYMIGIYPALFRVAPVYWRETALPAYLAVIDRWRAVDPAAASDDELLEGARQLARADAIYWGAASAVVGAAKISDAVLGWALALLAPGRDLTSATFLRGLPSRTLAAEADLDAIAAEIRASESLAALVRETPADRLREALAGAPGGAEIARLLDDSLARYGHQIYSLDFAEPTLADEPLPVLLTLKARVQQPEGDAASRRTEAARERDRLTAETARSLDPVRRFLFRRVVRWARRVAPYREDALFFVGAAWPTLRRLVHELGLRLADAGSLAAPDDVYFLDSSKVRAASAARAEGRARPNLAALARERRELREAQARLHPPASVPPEARFEFGPFDMTALETQRRNALEGATLRGFAVSPGRVTAPASVIRSPAEFGQMAPGSILVCPTTTPAWTPLFGQARGLVTDIGGVLAHGSIVAREYGIPAVMGTGNATRRIASGQTITVDGDAGTVTIDS